MLASSGSTLRAASNAFHQVGDCPNCGGIHFGSTRCPYTAEEGVAFLKAQKDSLMVGRDTPHEATKPTEADSK